MQALEIQPGYTRTSLLSLCGLVVVLAYTGCAIENPGITPPTGELYFPVGFARDFWRDPAQDNRPDPTRPVLLVSNSNADLRFNGGTVTALDMSLLPHDLELIGSRVEAGTLDCSPDRLDPSRWECPEGQFIYPDATVRIGDFPNEIRLSLALPATPPRLYVPVRGQDYLGWLDVVSLDDGTIDLRCNSDPEKGCDSTDTSANCVQWDCDEDHRVQTSEFSETELVREPFGIELSQLAAVHIDSEGRRRTCTDKRPNPPSCDCGDARLCNINDPTVKDCCSEAPRVDHVYISHLEGGEISFFLSDAAGVQLRDFHASMFDVGGTPVGGAFALASSVPGDPTSPTYVTSQFDGDLTSFVIRDSQRIVQTDRVPITTVNPPLGSSSDFRGIAFGRDPERLYVASRAPSSVSALRVRDEQGVRSYDPLWVASACSEPSVMVLGPNLQRLHPLAQLIYVVCFGDSRILVIDADLGESVGEIQTGRGPNSLLLDVGTQRPCVADSTCEDLDEVCRGTVCLNRHPRAFVANFLENTIGIIDLDPASRSYLNMRARIGLARKMVDD